MKKMLKRLCTGFLALATVVTALPTTPVHAESKQYWTESKERVGIVEKVMNDGSIGSTFNEGHLTVEGEDAYCIDINTDFKNGYKTRADASTRMSADQISDVALSIEYVKQYTDSHSGISKNHAYLLRQLVVWQRLSVHLGWQCDNVRASYDEIPKATQDEVFAGAKAFVKENKGRYECGGYIYSGEGQELGQFWAKLNVGNTKLQKVSSNTSITDGNGNYSIAGATYGVFSDKDCTKQLATLTTDENGNTDVVEVKAGTVYIKELSAPAGYKVDKTVYSLKVEAGKTATLKVSDTPKVTDTLIELFKIDMETQKDNPQGNASLAGAEFTWKYYAGFYNKDNLPAEATRTWVTKTIAETDSDGTIHYVTKLADAYKVSGDSFYMQDGKAVLPLGTLTVEETKAPNGYLLDGAYMQAGDKSEQIKGLYVTQITEDGDLAVLSGSNQFSVSDKVIRGGVKIQKRDLETGDTKPQGSATLKDTAFDIISLNDNAVLVEGKLYKKNEVVKTIHTDIEGVASTSADLLPYGKFRIVESEAPNGYLTDGAKPIDFAITENGKIVDLTDEAHSIYNQIKRGDIEGVKIGAGTHKRLADVPFRITSKTTGESHVVVTDDNGQFSTSSDWASHKHNTNAGRAVSAGGISGGVAGAVAGSAVAGKRAERKNTASKENRGNTTSSMGQRAGSKVGAVLDTKNKVKDKANAVKENIKDMPTQTAYAVYSAKEKAKSSVSDFKRGMVQEQQSRQTGRLEKQEQRKKNIADKRMELQKAQEARQAQRKADGSATTGATRPHERPATASTIPKPSAEKMQEVKRPATATTSKASEPVKTNVIKERPLSSGASDRKATQSVQPVHRQNVEKVVSQETRQNYTKDRRTKVQQTQSVQKNQQTIEKTRNLVTKKGQKKK